MTSAILPQAQDGRVTAQTLQLRCHCRRRCASALLDGWCLQSEKWVAGKGGRRRAKPRADRAPKRRPRKHVNAVFRESLESIDVVTVRFRFSLTCSLALMQILHSFLPLASRSAASAVQYPKQLIKPTLYCHAGRVIMKGVYLPTCSKLFCTVQGPRTATTDNAPHAVFVHGGITSSAGSIMLKSGAGVKIIAGEGVVRRGHA
ncbi:hypothetical protein NM688_g6449 [Phlebia brevispora]|uniref:Uncharacterized protein n=1 Tax=Phlebia brevispora TaxID=194682 RepID=A0ACC1SFY7_9APHY|nr:hypothetical protein NM688_g6449 [Phlebia brevispora]